MDFDDTPEEAAFRKQVADWLAANAPKTTTGGMFSAELNEKEALKMARAWQAKKAAAGYAKITWPKEMGGMGGTAIQNVIYSQEEAKYNLPGGFFDIG
ncbi:MAG TPA: acyl-CoA dehydrogenase, partial [Alphaproteobacteria bacterium]|nr:acyl-CoA dehydrogenase [Alphaproteobacteria bacterium]